MRKRVLQTVLVSGLIAAQVVLQFPTVVYAESGEEVQTEVASTSGSTEGTSGADEGTSGATEGTSGSTEGTSGADEGTSGSTEGTSGSTGASAEGSESNEAAGGTTAEGSESESSDSNEANTGEGSESSEGTSGSVGGNSEDTSDTSETGSTESAELTYKVTFKDSLDETFEVVVEVEENASAEAPEAPEHEGYAFIEWDADFSSVTEDMTVTAQYEEVVATPVLRSPLRSPAGGTSPAFNKTLGGGITVEAEAGVIPDGAYLTGKAVHNEAALRDNIYKKYNACEIDKMYSSGFELYTIPYTVIQPNGSVKITFKLAPDHRERLPYMSTTAFYADEDANITLIPCTFDGVDTFSFEVDHLGIYGVAYIDECYTVTYETNGGSTLSPVNVRKGNDPDLFIGKQIPVKANEVFEGWYLDSSFNEPYSNTKIDKMTDFTLYAKWGTGGDAFPAFESTLAEVTIKAAEGVLPEGARFEFYRGYGTDVYVWGYLDKFVDTKRKTHISLNTNGTCNYDIFFWDKNGKRIRPNGTVNVTIKCNTSDHDIAAGFYATPLNNASQASVKDRLRKANITLDKDNETISFDISETFDSVGAFTAKQYFHVEYNPNGGYYLNGDTVRSGNVINPWQTTTKAGFVFDGWYRDAGLTQPFTSTDVVTSNMTLYAKWKENTCTVTFDSKGGSPVPSSSVQKGTTYMTMPADPTKADATFVGWYKDEDCTIPFDRSEAINSDMTLYAKWRQNTYSVTYVVPNFFDTYLRFDHTFTLNSGNRVISINNGDIAYKPVNTNGVNERGVYTDLASYMTFDSASRSWTVKEIPQVGYTDPHPAYLLKFYGWYKDPAYTIPYDFTEPVTENITLYAKTDKIPLAFGTVIDFYFDYGYNETMQKIGRVDETGSRWYPDTSWNSSHIVKKKLYYAKWVEDPDPTQMVRIPSPFSSNAARGTEGVDSGYKMYFYTQASEQIAPEGYLASSQMYPGTVAVFFRYLFKDDSNPVPPTTPVQPSNPTPTPSDDPTPNPSEDPTPSVSPTPSVEPTETPSPTVSPSVSPAPSATPSPTVKPSAKPTQKPDSEDDEEDESGVLSSKHEVMDLIAEEVKEGSLTYVESDQFGFSRAYTLRSLNLDGKVKRVVNTKEI